MDVEIEAEDIGRHDELDLPSPYTVSPHSPQVILPSLVVLDEQLVVILMFVHALAYQTSYLPVSILMSVHLVAQGPEEAVSVPRDVLDSQSETLHLPLERLPQAARMAAPCSPLSTLI